MNKYPWTTFTFYVGTCYVGSNVEEEYHIGDYYDENEWNEMPADVQEECLNAILDEVVCNNTEAGFYYD